VTNIVAKHVELIIEDHCRSLLTLEFNANSAITGIQEFNLYDRLFPKNWLTIFGILLCLFSGLGESNLPGLI